jgi:CelD/BcsL family acetyltransferase involved in cellulose biosynthesis
MNGTINLREARSIEVTEWDKLITRFANHRVTHTLAWLRSLENSFNGKALFLIYEKDGEIVGCLPGMMVNVGFLRLFGSPLPGWQTVSMGPVFDPGKISTDEMIAPLAHYLETKYGVHHIEIMSNCLDQKAMELRGFRGRTEYTFQTSLFPEDESKALKAMKTSARRNIKRAHKLDLDVKFRDDDDFVDEVYDQINEVFLRGGNVVPFSKKRVAEFFFNMKRSGTLLPIAVEMPDSGTCIATGLFTVANKELLLWMWTHRSQYRWCRPTEAMTWEVMRKAMRLGCLNFDLMGRGDFKAKFGATLKSDKTRWVRSRYRLLTVARDMSERFYRLQQSVRGKYARRKLDSSVA